MSEHEIDPADGVDDLDTRLTVPFMKAGITLAGLVVVMCVFGITTSVFKNPIYGFVTALVSYGLIALAYRIDMHIFEIIMVQLYRLFTLGPSNAMSNKPFTPE